MPIGSPLKNIDRRKTKGIYQTRLYPKNQFNRVDYRIAVGDWGHCWSLHLMQKIRWRDWILRIHSLWISCLRLSRSKSLADCIKQPQDIIKRSAKGIYYALSTAQNVLKTKTDIVRNAISYSWAELRPFIKISSWTWAFSTVVDLYWNGGDLLNLRMSA